MIQKAVERISTPNAFDAGARYCFVSRFQFSVCPRTVKVETLDGCASTMWVNVGEGG
jgi:hypothetical protein